MNKIKTFTLYNQIATLVREPHYPGLIPEGAPLEGDKNQTIRDLTV